MATPNPPRLRYDERDKKALGVRAFNQRRREGLTPPARPTVLLTHAQAAPDSEGCIGRLIVPMAGILKTGAVSVQRKPGENGQKPSYRILFKVIEGMDEKTWSMDLLKDLVMEELNWGVQSCILEVYLVTPDLGLFNNPSISFVFEPN
jgi:hypothetical protein